jgi:NADPH:quinone reductase-like Zn-dependent oxidoreductase
MKAFVRDTYGSPDVLELREVPRPVIGDDGVLVRIRASSLNQADLDYLYGKPFLTRLGTGLRKPRNRGLGLDVAGQVEAVGSGVTAFRAGDDVFGDLTQFGYGAFAEYAGAPERAWAHKPPGMTFEEAATVPQAAILALQGLKGRRRIGPGDQVLVNGASGNVGPFAVQIAKSFGAEVTGVCSSGKMDLVRSIGADHVIDYRKDDVTRRGQRYDWIVDVVGTRSILEWRRVLKPGGVYATAGGPTARIFEALLLGPLMRLIGNRKMGLLWWKPFKREDVAILSGLIEAGGIRPVIDRSFPRRCGTCRRNAPRGRSSSRSDRDPRRSRRGGPRACQPGPRR